ncbi:hypothetical protein [Bartonella vinsonii]|uniref:hypothetical protein n=1 Tax=Bartonella vinsonii TaxID=33047 RepID=UPI00047C8D73|nr:hypothetical protein [Bartonella vinsonii]
MKQTLKLLSGIMLLTIAGCNIDKPPPGYLSMWEKPGADFTEVGKALLECGMPHLNYLEDVNRKLSNNAIATIYACMVQAGFRKKSGGPYWCYNYKDLPICQPGAVIPQRSVERRLNSPFCKRSPVQPECQP